MTTNTLNHLELKPAGHYSNLGAIFDVYVDGVCFLSNITQFEKRFHQRLNGAYTAALGCNDIMHSMTTMGSRFMPYACDCGEWQCWLFQGVVSGYENFICWGDWRNVHRDDKSKVADGLYWNYKEFPTLCFDKSQYMEEINKARAIIAKDKASQKILKRK